MEYCEELLALGAGHVPRASTGRFDAQLSQNLTQPNSCGGRVQALRDNLRLQQLKACAREVGRWNFHFSLNSMLFSTPTSTVANAARAAAIVS